MLVAEAVPLIWEQPGLPNQKTRLSIGELSHVFGWHMAYGLSILRIALCLTQQYNLFFHGGFDTGYLVEIENKLTVLAFCIGNLLLLPYWRLNVSYRLLD